MKCEQAKDMFLAYHDGDLAPMEAAALEAHFGECEVCQSDWEAYKCTLDEVSGMFRVAPPEGFTQRVKQTIGKRSRGRFFNEDRNFSVSFAIISFLLIIIVLLTYIIITSSREIEVVSPAENAQGTSEDGPPDSEAPPER